MVRTLCSSEGYQLVLMCGRPRDKPGSDWMRDVAEPAAELMKQAADTIYNQKEGGRPGDHRAKTVGVGMGGGRTQPGPSAQKDLIDTLILASLVAHAPFQRIVGFANSMFRSFNLGLHSYYSRTMDVLFAAMPFLHRVFTPATSVFASFTFNFGPQTVTHPHLDLANLAWGWCFITALGWFDAKIGGFLVLWDLKIYIPFPPGSTIGIPSALLRHSNVGIQPGKIQYLFTQFSAGGLFRYVEDGFQLTESVQRQAARMSAAQREELADIQMKRFANGIKMYTVHADN
ncbi:hypothetical protein C8F01DRAFT_1000854 [Mycena amicta]|nr:hypothetical protein C8F01DRAFT_1000854 [Mycena amicta]